MLATSAILAKINHQSHGEGEIFRQISSQGGHMRYAAAFLAILLISGCTAGGLSVTDSCLRPDCPEYVSPEDNALRASYLKVLTDKVDSRQMTADVMIAAMNKFDHDMQAKDARMLLQYKALVELHELEYRQPQLRYTTSIKNQ